MNIALDKVEKYCQGRAARRVYFHTPELSVDYQLSLVDAPIGSPSQITQMSPRWKRRETNDLRRGT
jgi:hypothetical protein